MSCWLCSKLHWLLLGLSHGAMWWNGNGFLAAVAANLPLQPLPRIPRYFCTFPSAGSGQSYEAWNLATLICITNLPILSMQSWTNRLKFEGHSHETVECFRLGQLVHIAGRLYKFLNMFNTGKSDGDEVAKVNCITSKDPSILKSWHLSAICGQNSWEIINCLMWLAH